MQVFRSEVKVGLLILTSFVLFTIGIFVVSDIKELWHEKKSITLLFPYADGITVGSPVMYAGFGVGSVSDVRIANRDVDRIAITVKIAPEAKVRQDSPVEIRNLSMMGAKYIEITPGSPDSPLIPSGGTLDGKSPASMSEIMETGRDVAAHLLEVAKEAQAMIHDIRTDAPIKETVQNANGLMQDMRDRTKDLKPLIAKLGSVAESLDQTGHNVKRISSEGGKELTALLKELRDTNKSLQKRLVSVETNLNQTLGQIGKGANSAENFVQGARSVLTSGEADIAALLKHLNETSENLKALSDDLRDHPWKVVWKKDGTPAVIPTGTQEWRDKGRIGPHGKE